MRTFLVTPKMSPELRARLVAKLDGRRREPGDRFRVGGGLSLMRLAPVFALAVVVGLFLLARRSAESGLEARRGAARALLEDVRRPLASVDQAVLPEVLGWIERAALGLEVDGTADLDDASALDAWLRRPGLYVRGTTDELSHRATIAHAAAASIKDAFLYCLFVPPASRAERDLLTRVRGVNFGGAVVGDRTKTAQRLHELEAGLALFGTLEDAIRGARSQSELAKLEVRIKSAPVAEAMLGAGAEVLFVVVDEPPGARPTEPENEVPHTARVTFVDLVRREVVLSVRRPLGLADLSPTTRASYAGSVQGCALAFDVREAALE